MHLFTTGAASPTTIVEHGNWPMVSPGIPGVSLDPEAVETNIVMFDVSGSALEVLERLKEAGVAMVPFGPSTIRATTHRDVDDRGISLAIEAARKVLA